MHYLIFELSGEMAMWRNPYESMGSFSCLGPAPSNIAGIIGSAMGFASPRSQAATKQDAKQLAVLQKRGLPWPISQELLKWQVDNDYHVACRWLGGFPKRISWNVNGYKTLTSNDNLRMQQQVIENPVYEVVLKLSFAMAEQVSVALKTPAFPIFMGASFCRAIIKKVRVQGDIPAGSNWAYHKNDFAVGESTPLSRHIVDAEKCFERIHSDGYWVFPTPAFSGEQQSTPFVKGYFEAETAE